MSDIAHTKKSSIEAFLVELILNRGIGHTTASWLRCESRDRTPEGGQRDTASRVLSADTIFGGGLISIIDIGYKMLSMSIR
jgi:hypothetical protein